MSKEEKITLKASLEVESLKGAEKIRNAFESDQAFRHKELQMNQLSSQLSRAGFGPLSGVIDDKDVKKLKQLQVKEIEENKKKLEDLNKVLKRLIGGIETYEKAIAKAKEEGKGGRQVVLEEEKERLKEKIKQKADEQEERANELKEKLEKLQGNQKGKNIEGFIQDMRSGNTLAALTSLLGASVVTTAITAIAIKGTQQILSMPRSIISSTGAAKETMVTEPLKNLLDQNKVFQEVAFSKQRELARQMASKETQGFLGQSMSRMTTWEGALSMIPIVQLLTRGGAEVNFKAKLKELEAGRQKEIFERLKDIDPDKKIATEIASKMFFGNLPSQRMMGLSDVEFFGKGGFQKRAIESGFDPEMANAMAAQMQAAGASTRGMRGLSTLGLQAQRGYDLTNAGTVLGRISGVTGDEIRSEAIFRKLLTESVKAGLDSSNFREEQRKFADITSQILSTSGATTSEQAEKIIQGFSKFLGKEPTTKELEGARTAYDLFQASTAEAGGRGGAIQFASMMKRGLGKMGFGGMAGLMELPEQRLDPKDPFIITEAVKMGISPEKLIELVKQSKEEKELVQVGLDPRKMKYLQKKGIAGKTLSEEELKKLKVEDYMAFEAYTESEEAVTRKYSGLDYASREAMARGYRLTGKMEEPKKDLLRAQKEVSDEEMKMWIDQAKKMETTDTGKAADEVIKGFAKQSDVLLEKFVKFKDVMVPTAERLQILIDKTEKLGQAPGFNLPSWLFPSQTSPKDAQKGEKKQGN